MKCSKFVVPGLGVLLTIVLVIGVKYLIYNRSNAPEAPVEISTSRVEMERGLQPFLTALDQVMAVEEISAEQRAELLAAAVEGQTLSEVCGLVNGGAADRTQLFAAILTERFAGDSYLLLADVLSHYGDLSGCPDKSLFLNLAAWIRAGAP